MRIKLKNISKKSTYWLSIAIVGTVLGISIQFVRAWTPPTKTAPDGNVSAPVLTSPTTEQTITKTLTVENLIVKDGGYISLKGDPIYKWPTGSVDGVVETSGNVEFTTPGVHYICIYPTNNVAVTCEKVLSPMFGSIDVQIWGAGGGGGNGVLSANGRGDANAFTTGSGGGSGAYSHTKMTVSGGDVIIVNVGRGATGAVSNGLTAGYGNIAPSGEGSSVSVEQSSGGYSATVQVGGGAGGFSQSGQHNEDYFWCGSAVAPGGTVTIPGNLSTDLSGNAGQSCIGGSSVSTNNGLVGSFGTTRDGGAGVVSPITAGKFFGGGGTGTYSFATVPALTCSFVTYTEVCYTTDEQGGCVANLVANPATYTYLTPIDFPTKYADTFNDPDFAGCSYTTPSALQFTPFAGSGENGGAIIKW